MTAGYREVISCVRESWCGTTMGVLASPIWNAIYPAWFVVCGLWLQPRWSGTSDTACGSDLKSNVQDGSTEMSRAGDRVCKFFSLDAFERLSEFQRNEHNERWAVFSASGASRIERAR
jgi:hypothetical protein